MSEKPYQLWQDARWIDQELERLDGDTSQFGESTLAKRILDEKNGDRKHRWCFEVGAGDPTDINTTRFFRELGWAAVLIEKDERYIKRLEEAQGRVFVVHEEVTSLDETLSKVRCPWCSTPFPYHPDLGVIDIDGQDYWLWHDLTLCKPAVMIVEYGPKADPEYIPQRTGKNLDQAGWRSIMDLGLIKGYVPVYKTLCNVIFANGR